MIPQIGVQMDMCPSTAGFKSWRSMAYSPQTNALYVPINLNCEHATFGPGPAEKVIGRGGSGPVRRRNYMHPESDGNLGEFRADGRERRKHAVAAAVRVADEYGVAHHGRRPGLRGRLGSPRLRLRRHQRQGPLADAPADDCTGIPDYLFRQREQYVAVPAGIGGGSWSTLIAPELRPDIRRPLGGNSLMVFALPAPPTAR